MKTFEIKGESRADLGKKAAKKIRKNEMIPCVFYGDNEVVHFQANETEFRDLIYSPNVYLVKLNVNDKTYDAILQDIQFHPVTDKILHIDFLKIASDRPVKIAVPVKLSGFAVGVKAGGKLHQVKRKLFIKSLPANLPDEITINVENLELGKTIKVVDVELPNIEILDSKNDVVAAVRTTRVAKGMAAETEGPAVAEQKAENE